MLRHTLRLGLLAILITGCPEVVQSPSGIVPVSGTVIYKDVPVGGALVTFIPDKGPKASGTTDTDGQFKLTTTLPNDGAVSGPHRITIELLDALDPDNPYAERKSLLPTKYSSLQESGLKEVVGEKRTFEFKLVD